MQKPCSVLFGLLSLGLILQPAWGQGSPIPGQGAVYQSQGYSSAPVPGAAVAAPNAYAQPAAYASNGAAPPAQKLKGTYSKLPLNIDDAKARISELRSALSVSRPQDVQESIFQLAEWLSDMADAHWKLSLALAKNDGLKGASAQEKASALKFSSLKHEANLLKAELFIKQNRLPEALGPLVDIVVAEPKSLIGQAAYEKLKAIGFSEEAADAGYAPVAKSTTTVSTAPTAVAPAKTVKTVQVVKTTR